MGAVISRSAHRVPLQRERFQPRQTGQWAKILRTAHQVVPEGEASNAAKRSETVQRMQAVVAEE